MAGKDFTHSVRPKQDLTGQRFGSLEVVEFMGFFDRLAYWLCRCDCGNTAERTTIYLRNPQQKSCGHGCPYYRGGRYKHGQSYKGRATKEYATWTDMLTRCYNQNSTRYSDYGGRGITVCRQWKESFADFYTDMGDKPSRKHSIGRIDNDIGYTCGRCEECLANGSPKNCRWETQTEQVRNRRNTRFVTWRGETLPLAVWAERVGIHYDALLARLHLGWDIERMLTTPLRLRRRQPAGQE